MLLDELTAYSHFYGGNEDLVLAGGGNTSAKDGNIMYIKGSGTRLATIQPEEFVKMDREKLAGVFTKAYPNDDKTREAMSLQDISDAMCPGQEGKRPSVETTLHSLFPQTFVLHLHPAAVNGVTCARDGEKTVNELFGDEAVWVSACRPGYVLAKICADLLGAYRDKHKKPANLVFLENHGVFFASDTVSGLGTLLEASLAKITARIKREPDFATGNYDAKKADAVDEAIHAVFGADAVSVFEPSTVALEFAKSPEAVQPLLRPLTPDHIVYCKAYPLYLTDAGELAEKTEAYREANGFLPKILMVKDCGVFSVDFTQKGSVTASELWNDCMKVAVYAESFGGVSPMSEELTDFIVHWEAEAYRSKKNQG